MHLRYAPICTYDAPTAHMVSNPEYWGKRYSAAVIGLQMASAYIGSTFMPMVFGHIQQAIGIGIMPLYLLIFAALNFGMLEIAYRKIVG